jgi:hypothetical protein
MRRFFARPSSVWLEAIGWVSPAPRVRIYFFTGNTLKDHILSQSFCPRYRQCFVSIVRTNVIIMANLLYLCQKNIIDPFDKFFKNCNI